MAASVSLSPLLNPSRHPPPLSLADGFRPPPAKPPDPPPNPFSSSIPPVPSRSPCLPVWTSLFKKLPRNAGSFSPVVFEPVFDGDSLALPPEVVSEGNSVWQDKIVGFFLDKPLPYSVVIAKLKLIWKLHGTIKVRSDGVIFVFSFSNLEDRDRILNADPIFMFNKIFIIKPFDSMVSNVVGSVRSVPVWLQLSNIPLIAWTPLGLNWLCCRLGQLLCLDGMTESLDRIAYARCLVSIKPDAELVDDFLVNLVDGGKQKIYVKYLWRPELCTKCRVFGHRTARCEQDVVNDNVLKEMPEENTRNSQRTGKEPCETGAFGREECEKGHTAAGKTIHRNGVQGTTSTPSRRSHKLWKRVSFSMKKSKSKSKKNTNENGGEDPSSLGGEDGNGVREGTSVDAATVLASGNKPSTSNTVEHRNCDNFVGNEMNGVQIESEEGEILFTNDALDSWIGNQSKLPLHDRSLHLAALMPTSAEATSSQIIKETIVAESADPESDPNGCEEEASIPTGNMFDALVNLADHDMVHPALYSGHSLPGNASSSSPGGHGQGALQTILDDVQCYEEALIQGNNSYSPTVESISNSVCGLRPGFLQSARLSADIATVSNNGVTLDSFLHSNFNLPVKPSRSRGRPPKCKKVVEKSITQTPEEIARAMIGKLQAELEDGDLDPFVSNEKRKLMNLIEKNSKEKVNSKEKATDIDRKGKGKVEAPFVNPYANIAPPPGYKLRPPDLVAKNLPPLSKISKFSTACLSPSTRSKTRGGMMSPLDNG